MDSHRDRQVVKGLLTEIKLCLLQPEKLCGYNTAGLQDYLILCLHVCVEKWRRRLLVLPPSLVVTPSLLRAPLLRPRVLLQKLARAVPVVNLLPVCS